MRDLSVCKRRDFESVRTPAGKVLVPVQPPTPKKIVYEIIDATSNLTPQYVAHNYSTVFEAASHLGAGCYFVAVEDGWMRQLTPEEEEGWSETSYGHT